MILPALAPGGTIGILGGGQLGRMLALAAAELGLRSHIYCPDPDSPAFEVAHQHSCATYEDEEALSQFVASVDRVTFEFENVPHFTAAFLASRIPVLPSEKALRLTQDRLDEKRFITGLGLNVAPYAQVDSIADLHTALDKVGRPAVLKTRRFGYDGKGQATIRAGDDPLTAWATIGEAPAVLEGFVSFALECSIIVGRSAEGQVAAYDIVENHHENHILKTSTVPAQVTAATAAEAVRIGQLTAEALGFVGVLAVELFVVRNGTTETLVVNEIAPRVHNSGHWTQDGCLVSQFEQHIRAVAGWPLGSPARSCDVVMTNLLGDDIDLWQRYAEEPGTAVHLYGKRVARDGRKMGHINRLTSLSR